MSFPSTWKVLSRDGELTTITGAACRTVTPRLFYKGKMHKFGLSAAEVGGGMGGAFSALIDGGAVSTSGVLAADPYYATVPTASTVLAKHDAYTQTDPRHTSEKLDIVEFWDAATPGFAMTCSVTTTSGSASVVVSDASKIFTIGQGISGTGIPSGAKIIGIAVSATPATATTLYLSHQCTGSATVEATLTGANVLATFEKRDIKQEGAAITSLI